MTNEDQNNKAGPGNRDDDIDSVIDMLRAAAGDESIPDDVSGLDSGDDTKKGPASHKFAEQQKRLKTALSLIERQRQQLGQQADNAERGGSQGGGNAAPPQRGRAEQDEAIYLALSRQACINLGINQREDAPRVFDLELARLWNDNAQRVERQREAKESAPAFVENELNQFDQLDGQDRQRVTERLRKLDILQQVDPRVVRREVASYLGEKALSGQSFGGGTGGGSDSSGGGSSMSGDARPVGDVKNRGSSGVRPGNGAPRRDEGPKPPTPEETKEMKTLGFQDVEAYRKAKQKKDQYRGR